MVTTSLLWGWVPLAGALCLCWGSLLRAGEFLAARRETCSYRGMSIKQFISVSWLFWNLKHAMQVRVTKRQSWKRRIFCKLWTLLLPTYLALQNFGVCQDKHFVNVFVMS